MNEEQKNETNQNAAIDYIKTLGRDGSYLELDIDTVGSVFMDCLAEDKWPKQVVLKAGRYDITDPFYIEAMKVAFEWFVKQNEIRGMPAKQLGFLFFKNVFDAGLRYMVREHRKPMIKYGDTKVGDGSSPLASVDAVKESLEKEGLTDTAK